MLALNKGDIREVVSMRDAIELVKLAFRELTEGRAQVPLRSVIDVTPGRDAMLLMPAFLPGMSSLGFKVISIFQENGKRGLRVRRSWLRQRRRRVRLRRRRNRRKRRYYRRTFSTRRRRRLRMLIRSMRLHSERGYRRWKRARCRR